MTQEIINRLKELLTKATEGPWEVQPRTFSTTFFLVRRDRTTDEHCIADVTRREDADAIAAVFNLLSTLTNLTPSGVERIVDLDRNFWNSLVAAAAESNWIPPEYYVNDWVSDCADFLRNGTLALPSEPPSQGDVEGWATLAKRLCEVHAKITPFIESGLSPFQDSFTLEDGNILLDAALALASKEDGRS